MPKHSSCQQKTSMADLSKVSGWITCLESKGEDLENHSQRKNLWMFRLRQGEEGNQQLLEYMQEICQPGWVLITRSHWKGLTVHWAQKNQTKTEQSSQAFWSSRTGSLFSVAPKCVTSNTMEINSPRLLDWDSDLNSALFINAGSFWGFQQNPCRVRVLHNGNINLFSSPEDAEKFHRRLWRDGMGLFTNRESADAFWQCTALNNDEEVCTLISMNRWPNSRQ